MRLQCKVSHVFTLHYPWHVEITHLLGSSSMLCIIKGDTVDYLRPINPPLRFIASIKMSSLETRIVKRGVNGIYTLRVKPLPSCIKKGHFAFFFLFSALIEFLTTTSALHMFYVSTIS